jgi:hypothetical protein
MELTGTILAVVLYMKDLVLKWEANSSQGLVTVLLINATTVIVNTDSLEFLKVTPW